MLANAYEFLAQSISLKTPRGFSKSIGSVPIQVIGQLAEAMGFQTQLGSVKISKISKNLQF